MNANLSRKGIVKVGNILNEAKSLFASLNKREYKERVEINYKSFQWLNTSDNGTTISNKVQEIEDLMLSFIKGKYRYNGLCRSSWCGFLKKGSCIEWHEDGLQWEDKKQQFLITAFPHPTEILTNARLYKGWKHADCYKPIILSEPEILVPELGDVYLLNRHVIHRSNPKDFGKFHLVLRVYIHPC